MCGICGIVDFGGALADEPRVRRMTNVLRHRGPDSQNVFAAGSAALGHTRLSILDLSTAGDQPMHTPDGRWSIAYNGEVYNYRDLRRRLQAQGVVLRSDSDTEVVLESFARWGVDVLRELNGMFAFAVWDARTEQLHLARDRFGIKPLYIFRLPQGVVFGSEIKAVLASGAAPRELNWEALHEYLYYGNPLGERTMFADVVELPPGRWLTVSRDGWSGGAFWRVDEVEPVRDDFPTALENVRRRLDQAVRDHLVSDVPVGVFLSGGIDSSAITLLASKHHGPRLKTFSVGFDYDGGVNELPEARRVAEQAGAEHHELHVSSANAAEVIETLVRQHDEPFADAANIPLYLLCEQLRGAVKVVLQGDGGDEIFAGYRRYSVLAQRRAWLTLSRFAKPFARLAPDYPQTQRAIRFLDAVGQRDPAIRAALLMSEETAFAPPTRVLSPEALDQVRRFDPFAAYREIHARLASLDEVQRMLYTDCAILLPNQFLEKVDKATMANSIEVRVPFLDANLTTYVMGLPSHYKVRGGEKKWLLRQALRGIVPNRVLDRPKTGFGVPYKHWLRTSLAGYLKSVLLDPTTIASGVFDRQALASCIDDHIAGRRNNGHLLYKLLNLALWMNLYLQPTAGFASFETSQVRTAA